MDARRPEPGIQLHLERRWGSDRVPDGRNVVRPEGRPTSGGTGGWKSKLRPCFEGIEWQAEELGWGFTDSAVRAAFWKLLKWSWGVVTFSC